MIKIQNLSHTYQNRDHCAVDDVNFHITKGENVIIIGSSGSGKSTLLKCINRLIEPTCGKIYINNQELLSSSRKDTEQIRGDVGMIFQNFHLLERETVIKNVLNGRLKFNSTLNTLIGKFSEQDQQIAHENIKIVDLLTLKDERVSDLSGGQKQRVAIARALCQAPQIILADEPVSSLDPKLMKEIMDMLAGICREKNITLVTSLHFLDLAKKYASRIIGMKNGQIIFDGKVEDLTEKDIVDIYGQTKEWNLYGEVGY